MKNIFVVCFRRFQTALPEGGFFHQLSREGLGIGVAGALGEEGDELVAIIQTASNGEDDGLERNGRRSRAGRGRHFQNENRKYILPPGMIFIDLLGLGGTIFDVEKRSSR